MVFNWPGFLKLQIALFSHVSFLLPSTSLSENAIFFRCYSQLVRAFPANNDPYLLKIKVGEITGREACISLLHEGDLDFRGNLKKSGEIGTRILKTLQSLHMSWFTAREFIKQETEMPTANLYDANEMGYHLTYSLFKNNEQFSAIFNRKESLRGIRRSNQANVRLVSPEADGKYTAINEKIWKYGEGENGVSWTPKLIEFGSLIGIHSMEAGENVIRNVDIGGVHITENTLTGSLGAGILGTKAFLLLNSNFETNLLADGASMVRRVWTKAIFSDLFCRDLPLISNSDAQPYVQPKSSISFRKKAECMRCHTSIDTMAGVVRNVMEVRTAGTVTPHFSPRAVAIIKTELPDGGLNEEASVFFAKQAPKGRIFFRNYRGELIDQNVQDLADLGEKISKMEDPYLCAAKRYFHFFTGNNVEMGDFSDPAFSNASEKNLEFRNFVIALGKELYSHQNIMKTLESIINSRYYSLQNYGN